MKARARGASPDGYPAVRRGSGHTVAKTGGRAEGAKPLETPRLTAPVSCGKHFQNRAAD
jgi:hypothetical protein